MRYLKIFILFIFSVSFSVSIAAQSKKKIEGSLNEGSIKEQFDYLYKVSPKWQDYKSIKSNKLFKFRDNIYDSLKLGRKKLIEERKIVSSQKSEIKALKQELNTTNDNLTSVTKEKDSINFFGAPLSKSGYNAILWSIITGLGALLLFFIIKFRQSNIVTVRVKKDKIDMEGEYDEYRRRSIEREQKLRRELQDELNKQKYMEVNSKKRK